MRFISFVIATIVSEHASAASASVQNWGAKEIETFFRDQCRVTPDAVKLAKITAQDLFDGILGDESGLEAIGITETLDKKRALACLAKLDKSSSSNPKDLWEWRYANRRLFDMWLSPLSGAPRILLIWLRYFHSDKDDALDVHDSDIDESNFVTFWATWFVAPNYPFYKISKTFVDKTSYIDEVFKWTYFFKLVGDVFLALTLLANVGSFIKNLQSRVLVEICVLFWALLNYYIFWWFIPNFLLDIWFGFSIYVVTPILVIFACAAPIFVFLAANDKSKFA